MDKLPPVLKLNVCGKIFYIKTSLITNDNYPLAKMFKGEFDRPYQFEDGSYYIEAHPECFESVLNFYRYGFLEQPPHIPTDFFISQTTYWGIGFAQMTDTSDVNSLVAQLGWPEVSLPPFNSKCTIQTIAVSVKTNVPHYVGFPDKTFMIEAIYAPYLYSINVNGKLNGNDILEEGVIIEGPLTEPIIPCWMGKKLNDRIFNCSNFDIILTSTADQTVLFKISTSRPRNKMALIELWNHWIATRVQTSKLYPIDSRSKALYREAADNADLEGFFDGPL